ncbi:aldo/keto reductase [Bacillus anthracis]|uniref:aldo/keto reductase n=1 Tax=Bacillus anthracis TaxID=1392 RepID=UPI0038220A74
MKKRQLGNSDLFVTEMGLGCMSLGTSEAEAMRIIDEAIDLGINFFDTADLYDYGLNEEFVGKALKGKRDQIVLTTKVGNRWTEEKNGWSWDPSKNYIKAEVKESLRRLQTDYIDLYQLHGGTIEDPIDETIEAFEEWFPLLNEHQISVIARGPLAKGILTDNNARKIERVKEKDYLSYSYDELYGTLANVKELIVESSLTGTAIQYCLHNDTVAAVIPGASSIQQLRENVQACKQTQLTTEEYIQLQQIAKCDTYALHR